MNINELQEEWDSKGKQYAQAINEMVSYGETYGWDKWKGEEPKDKREHLSEQILKLLREANKDNTITEFRQRFSPSYEPFVKFLNNNGQSIQQLCCIESDSIVFLTGTAYEKRQAYMLIDNKISTLDSSIDAIGKARKGNVFAIQRGDKVTTIKSWNGEIISEFNINQASIKVSQLLPFNDGKNIVIVSDDGVFLISETDNILLHPEPSTEDEDGESYLSMENAALSDDNTLLVVGSQDSSHKVFLLKNQKVEQIGELIEESSYPHFCLFSKDGSQLISNACHFYNGATLGFSIESLENINEQSKEGRDYIIIDEEMRVYAGVAFSLGYILGDAYGYIRAIDKQGKTLWRHFLGSTISGMVINEEETILWVGSYSGILHKLHLEAEQDSHTIGNGNLKEELRVILWKEESDILLW